MSILSGKKVLLGISGSIAAYKAVHIVREFIGAGCEVQVVMTEASKDFVTPVSLATMSQRPVFSRFIEEEQMPYGTWNNHVEMGLWADFMVVAPTSANTLAKLATGGSDNLLTAVYMSARCPVFVAPAMDLDMYSNGATQENLKTLNDRGVQIIDAEEGELASGLMGKGRMAEPEHILEAVRAHHESTLPLLGQRVVVNAGPTHEHIDPVRYIGNNSSGKMGVAIARAAYNMGASVDLILGPTSFPHNTEGFTTINVVSAHDMYEATAAAFTDANLCVCTAAVADYTPNNTADQKIKKDQTEMSIALTKTVDILQSLGKIKSAEQCLVGFALETQDGPAYAEEKLHKKNADAIVLNTLGKPGVGFEGNTNEVTVFTKVGEPKAFELQDKSTLGVALLKYLLESGTYEV